MGAYLNRYFGTVLKYRRPLQATACAGENNIDNYFVRSGDSVGFGESIMTGESVSVDRTSTPPEI
ncbi:MAG: hypothetical protein QF767_15925, partial [Alphaproteobacteria bacterium]|nr:hypothetical protein [Alphaproteobacteria bacterium]